MAQPSEVLFDMLLGGKPSGCGQWDSQFPEKNKQGFRHTPNSNNPVNGRWRIFPSNPQPTATFTHAPGFPCFGARLVSSDPCHNTLVNFEVSLQHGRRALRKIRNSQGRTLLSENRAVTGVLPLVIVAWQEGVKVGNGVFLKVSVVVRYFVAFFVSN